MIDINLMNDIFSKSTKKKLVKNEKSDVLPKKV